jgi:NarL family two-component system response regulator LiaR
MPQIRVLIVEDHQVAREGLAAGLSRIDSFEIVGEAGTSDEGLQLAQAYHPDVILLDLHLPGQAGPRTMVKEFCSIPGARVIIVSGEKRMAFVKVVMSLGVAAYLLKAETVATIAATIEAVMAGQRNILSADLTEDTKITPSEEDVLRLIGRGMKYQDIADKRYVSPHTVRKQCETLLLKLGLTSREELIAWAAQNGFASLED